MIIALCLAGIIHLENKICKNRLHSTAVNKPETNIVISSSVRYYLYMTIRNEFNFSEEWEAIQREVKSQVVIKRKELIKPIRDKYKQELKEVAHLWCGTSAERIKSAMKLAG